jgi:SAM-dependent methyltransferase
MTDRKFNPKHLAILNNPDRKKIHDPEVIWNTLELKDAEVLVDIGAGTGFFAMPFADKIPDGVVYACDTSEVMLDWMKDNLPKKYDGRIILRKTEESVIELDDQIADLVYMMLLHHELNNPQSLLQEAKRLLKPGGKILIMDWAKKETPMGPPMEIRVDADTIEEHMKEAGFNDIKQHDVLPFNSFLVGAKL